MSAILDRTMDPDKLAAALPAEVKPFVELLPACEECGDVVIDASIAVLLQLIAAMLASQDQAWRAGCVMAINNVLLRELAQANAGDARRGH